jgi:hypothetical protein
VESNDRPLPVLKGRPRLCDSTAHQKFCHHGPVGVARRCCRTFVRIAVVLLIHVLFCVPCRVVPRPQLSRIVACWSVRLALCRRCCARQSPPAPLPGAPLHASGSHCLLSLVAAGEQRCHRSGVCGSGLNLHHVRHRWQAVRRRVLHPRRRVLRRRAPLPPRRRRLGAAPRTLTLCPCIAHALRWC